MKRITSILAAALLAGCVTTPNGEQHVSPTALRITTAIVCAGSSLAVQEDPALISTFSEVRGYLTAWLDVPGTNFNPAEVQAKVKEIRRATTASWLAPALALLTGWMGDLTSFKEVGLAIRDGLNCAGSRGIAARTTGFKTDIVVIFQGADGEFYWRRVAPNGRIVSVWGEGSKRKWNCERSAKRVNPGLPIVFL